MKVYSCWSGHDCSFAVLEDGKPVVHAEYERYIREKEPAGDGAKFMFDEFGDCEDMKYFATVRDLKKLQDYEESFNRIKETLKKNDGEFYVIGHHQAHAANTFFSSNYKKALIVTMD